MEKYLYRKLYDLEKNYWWSKNKREHAFRLAERFFGPLKGKAALDVGCGAGCLLEELHNIKQVDSYGVDIAPESIAFCKQRGLENVILSSAEDLPFDSKMFDLIISLDVLEHISDDEKAIRECYRTLKIGGLAILAVPSFQSLWCERDERLMHKRRYTKNIFNERLLRAGFKILHSRYVNFSLFFPLLLTIRIFRLFNLKSEINIAVAYSPPLKNSILYHLNHLEYHLLDTLNLPLGTSLFTVVTKPN